ncbi:MAG: hypothetical protein FJ308_05440 [Planctomycetes bacterium]|nr:hypothetical protein [Planctomycetota bacterium]
MVLLTKFSFDARVPRSPGVPYTVLSSRTLQNNFRIRLANRSQQRENYQAKILVPEGAIAQWSDVEPELTPGETALMPLIVTGPVGLTTGSGSVDGTLELSDSSGNKKLMHLRLLGPR